MLPDLPVPKTHPASRDATPDDPLSLNAVELPGDPGLMLRLLVEEYARVGYDAEAIVRLAYDPNFQVFHGLLRLYGEENLCRQIREIVARCGVIRVRTVETDPADISVETLLQISR